MNYDCVIIIGKKIGRRSKYERMIVMSVGGTPIFMRIRTVVEMHL
jgi:hypothetical protein